MACRNMGLAHNFTTTLMGHCMETYREEAELVFLPSNNPLIDRVILCVKGGITRASIVCEDEVNRYISRVRDFRENETISILWSCSMASTLVHFFRVTISINLDMGVKEAAETRA
jgi:hypothetical protein